MKSALFYYRVDTCELPYMSVEDVDKAVWHLIVWPYLSDPKRIRAEVESQLKGNDRRPELREHLKRLQEQLGKENEKIGRIKDLAVAGALTAREAAEERQNADNEAAATKQAISKIEGEIAGYEMQRETLDNLEKLIESYRYRLMLYERKDNTDVQPTKRLRRKAFLDFVGDGNVTVSVQKPGLSLSLSRCSTWRPGITRGRSYLPDHTAGGALYIASQIAAS